MVSIKRSVGEKRQGCAGAEAQVCVFTACDELGGALSVAPPVELAASVNKAFELDVGAVEDGADDGVVVVELGVRGDNHTGPGPRVVPLLGSDRHGQGHYPYQQ